jgi:hypothetical protein
MSLDPSISCLARSLSASSTATTWAADVEPPRGHAEAERAPVDCRHFGGRGVPGAVLSAPPLNSHFSVHVSFSQIHLIDSVLVPLIRPKLILWIPYSCHTACNFSFNPLTQAHQRASSFHVPSSIFNLPVVPCPLGLTKKLLCSFSSPSSSPVLSYRPRRLPCLFFSEEACWYSEYWYVSNVSIISDVPCLFYDNTNMFCSHFISFLCVFRN